MVVATVNPGPGQVQRGRALGDALYELARRPDVLTALEVGTSCGDGSTLCLATALGESNGRLYSVELKREHHRAAADFYSARSLPVELIHGLSLTLADYLPFADYWPMIARTDREAVDPEEYHEWYEDEIAHAAIAPRQGVLYDLVERVGRFDMVFLDGGEFASHAEFELLEPHIDKFLVMDDTNGERCIKNALSRERVLASPRWDVLVDAIGERNGWLVARRLEA